MPPQHPVNSTSARRKTWQRAVDILWRRQLPYGMLSTRFLWPGMTANQALHWRLTRSAMPRLPRLIFWPVNIWIELRWLLFHGWYQSFRTVRHLGPAVADSHGIRLLRQYARVLHLALAHSIPPLAYYRYQLYASNRRDSFWDYVHPHEGAEYHQRNDNSQSRAERHLLGDKSRFAEEMQAHGVTIMASKTSLAAGSTIDDLPTGPRPLFCKPRIGSRALGAFKLEQTPAGEISIYPIGDPPLHDQDARQTINDSLRAQDYLVQPYYENHPGLQVLNPADAEAITLRIITRRRDGITAAYCAYLEIPVSANERRSYAPIQVDIENGSLLPENLDRLPPGQAEHTTLINAARGLDVSHWNDSLNMSLLAHKRFPNVDSIAWDLIITPTGPVLLEGNSNWRIDLPQQFCGGLLASR